MTSQVRYTESHGASIAYQVRGHGPRDLVIIPPIVSHLDAAEELPGYSRLLERLGSFARLIIFDKRGGGLSDRLAGAPSLEVRMDDLRAVMDAAGSKRAAVFGISEGGPLGVLFAASHPKRVASLILYGTFARFRSGDGHAFMHDGPQIERLIEQTTRGWGSGISMDLFAPSHSGEAEDRDRFARFERSAVSPSGLRRLWELVADIDVCGVLPQVRVPSLVLHRRDDVVVDVAAAEFLASQLADVELRVLEGRDHLPYFGDCTPLCDEIAAFLTGERSAGQHAQTRVLATVLFSDIVDSTAKAAALGDGPWRELLDAHDQLAERLVRAYGGRVIKTTGDGVLATFDGPGRGVRCGRDFALQARALGLAIRVGVHIGEIELRGADVGAIAVNVAARVQSKAGADEVWVSRTVTDLVADSGLRFEPRGEHELKGVPGPVPLFALAP